MAKNRQYRLDIFKFILTWRYNLFKGRILKILITNRWNFCNDWLKMFG